MSRLDLNLALERIARALSKNPGLSLKELVTVAQLPRATFYRWFSDREKLEIQLDTWCIGNLEMRLKKAMPGGLLAVLTELVESGALVRYVYVRREMLPSAPNDPIPQIVEEAFLAYAEAEKFDISVPKLWFDESVDALIYAAWRYFEKSGEAAEDCATLLLRSLRLGMMKGTI